MKKTAQVMNAPEAISRSALMPASECIRSKKLDALYAKYIIDENPIGYGSYGLIYKGRDKLTEERVAIKILRKFPHDDAIDAKRVLREIKLLHMLRQHNNIVSLQHIITSQANHTEAIRDIALIFKHHESDLAQIIRSKQTLTLEHAEYFLSQILHAMVYMHSANLVHRDLKPSNLLVDTDCTVTIADFGLARATQRLNEITHTTSDAPRPLYRKLTEYMVTRWYRCPEITLEYNHGGDAPADMWSIGCILAELLLRKPLFAVADHSSLIPAIIERIGSPTPEDCAWIENHSFRDIILTRYANKPNKIKELFSHIDPVTVDLIEKLLQFNPAKRLTAEQALQHPFFKTEAYKRIPLKFSAASLSTEEQLSLDVYYRLEEESEGCDHSIALTQRILTLIQAEIARYQPAPLSPAFAALSAGEPDTPSTELSVSPDTFFGYQDTDDNHDTAPQHAAVESVFSRRIPGESSAEHQDLTRHQAAQAAIPYDIEAQIIPTSSTMTQQTTSVTVNANRLFYNRDIPLNSDGQQAANHASTQLAEDDAWDFVY